MAIDPAYAAPGLDALLTQVPAVVWTTDRDLRILSVDGGALALVNADGAVGRTIGDYLGTRSTAVRVHRAALAGEGGEYDLFTSGAPWRVRVEPRRDDAGEIVGTVAVALDLTERERIDRTLRVAEEGTRSLVETLPLVVYTVSVGPDAEPRFIAPQVEELLGIPASEFTFHRLRAGIHPDDRDRAYASFDLADARAESLKVEYRFVRDDGTVVWVEDASRVTTIDGEPLAQGYLLDITDRKNAELDVARRASVRRRIADIGRASLSGASHEEVIRMSFDVLSEGLEAQAGSYLEFVGDRLVVVDCFGWDALGQVADERTPAGQACATKALWMGGADRRAGTKLVEYDLQSSIAAPIVLDDGACVGAITVHAREFDRFAADDASLVEQLAHLVAATISRARADERLHRSQRLEAVGQLAAGIAHDFNNLLTAISGYSELAQRLTDEQGRAYLDLVLRTSDRAKTLTSQLLAFSRKQVLRPRPLRLGELVSEALPMLAPLLGESIVVRAEIEDAVVVADDGQLENVLVNLAVNARDAMPDGGNLTIRTGTVTVPPKTASAHDVRPGRYGRLEVVDTGSGIEPNVLARIFEPFFTTKGYAKGTGLGLASVEGIVRQTGGFLTVSTAVGAGSTFAVHLPLGELSVHEAEPRRPGVIEGGRILVVEDEEIVRLLLAEQLTAFGLEVEVAVDGVEALERLGEQRFDVVLTDLGLPGIDGALLGAETRERYPGTRVLLMSGYPHDVVAERSIGADVVLLQKPFRSDELQDAVARALADR